MSVGFAPLRILSQSGVQKFAVFPFCGYDFRSLFRLSRLVGLAKQCLRPTILFVVKRTLPRSSFIEPGRRSASVEPQKLAAPTQSDGLPKPRGNGFGWPGPIQFQIETLIARIIQPRWSRPGRPRRSSSGSMGTSLDARYLECAAGWRPGVVVLPDDRRCDRPDCRGCHSPARPAGSSDRSICARWTGTRARLYRA